VEELPVDAADRAMVLTECDTIGFQKSTHNSMKISELLTLYMVLYLSYKRHLLAGTYENSSQRVSFILM
jgi:hypothetical protein